MLLFLILIFLQNSSFFASHVKAIPYSSLNDNDESGNNNNTFLGHNSYTNLSFDEIFSLLRNDLISRSDSTKAILTIFDIDIIRRLQSSMQQSLTSKKLNYSDISLLQASLEIYERVSKSSYIDLVAFIKKEYKEVMFPCSIDIFMNGLNKKIVDQVFIDFLEENNIDISIVDGHISVDSRIETILKNKVEEVRAAFVKKSIDEHQSLYVPLRLEDYKNRIREFREGSHRNIYQQNPLRSVFLPRIMHDIECFDKTVESHNAHRELAANLFEKINHLALKNIIQRFKFYKKEHSLMVDKDPVPLIFERIIHNFSFNLLYEFKPSIISFKEKFIEDLFVFSNHYINEWIEDLKKRDPVKYQNLPRFSICGNKTLKEELGFDNFEKKINNPEASLENFRLVQEQLNEKRSKHDQEQEKRKKQLEEAENNRIKKEALEEQIAQQAAFAEEQKQQEAANRKALLSQSGNNLQEEKRIVLEGLRILESELYDICENLRNSRSSLKEELLQNRSKIQEHRKLLNKTLAKNLKKQLSTTSAFIIEITQRKESLGVAISEIEESKREQEIQEGFPRIEQNQENFAIKEQAVITVEDDQDFVNTVFESGLISRSEENTQFFGALIIDNNENQTNVLQNNENCVVFNKIKPKRRVNNPYLWTNPTGKNTLEVGDSLKQNQSKKLKPISRLGYAFYPESYRKK